jgi:dienelactone hydrolase
MVGGDDHVMRVADRYAARGFRVLVPISIEARSASTQKKAEHLMGGLNFADAAGQNIRGAVQYLKQSSAKVGVTSYCMGSALICDRDRKWSPDVGRRFCDAGNRVSIASFHSVSGTSGT